MAEAAPWTTTVHCRYFKHGMCRAGSGCRYAHTAQDAEQEALNNNTNVCKYFLLGTCTYAEKCRYDHTKPRPSAAEDKKSTAGNNNNNRGPKPVKLSSSTASMSPSQSRMVTLRKQGHSSDSGYGEDGGPSPTNKEFPRSPLSKNAEQWVQAAEFVPGQPYYGAGPSSYSAAARCGQDETAATPPPPPPPTTSQVPESQGSTLCPYAEVGECQYGEDCAYFHGEICELCGLAALHPIDAQQRQKHVDECMKKHEEDMELSFAVARSKEKTCGICMDVIMEKQPPSTQRFGILSDCSHCYCLDCIRKWRAAKQFENKIVRACPECRTKSDFVTPSKYWVETNEEKKALIEGYKAALSVKACKYFDQGRGECPFNEKCFYKHAYPDGRIASPKPRRRRRQRQNANGELDLIEQIILWDFLEERELRERIALELGIEDMFQDIFLGSGWDSDSDSDYSDLDFFL